MSDDANVNPSAKEMTVTVGTGDDAEEYVCGTETCCSVCYTRGPKGHTQETCPKMVSINKIREQKGYVPILWWDGDWQRNDVKVEKSVESRVEKLEKEMGEIKTKVGALEAQMKQQGQKRKADASPTEGGPPKKQKGSGKKKEEAAKPQGQTPAVTAGEEKKKKRKRGKKGKKAADQGGVPGAA